MSRAPEPDRPPPGREAAGLDALFRPRSVAVVGTSRQRQSLGRRILDNLLDFGFQGMVFPVNPGAEVVHSMKCYPSLLAIPDPVDLAVIVVPRDAVPGVVRDCAEKGVRGVVIITAGFREIGGEGAALESRIVEDARRAGIRLVGPNCMGIINTEAAVRMDATFAAYLPLPGNVSFVSQSGALGEAILAACRRSGIGIHMFASVGNRADLSANDLLEYWEEDPATGVILLYLESFGNPLRFPAIARRVARRKPIIAVKAGGSHAGARAATSHTGALASVRDVTIDSLFEQTGILRARTLEEMLRMANALATQPLPRGKRVAIVTNAGGPGILATDACVQLGLEVPELEESTQARLREILPREASVANPVDMIATAPPESFRKAIGIAREDPSVDALIVIAVSLTTTDDVALATAIVDGVSGARIPVLACFMGKALSTDGTDIIRSAGIPAFDFPEATAQALASMDRHRCYRDRPVGSVPTFDTDATRAREIVDRALGQGREDLTFFELRDLLRAYGIPTVETLQPSSLEEAVEGARTLGYPVVLKFLPPGISHKTDVGAVRTDLETEDALTDAWNSCAAAFPGAPCLLQKMLKAGREVILGMARDPVFGPLIMFGLGGITVEALGDVAFRVHPLTTTDPPEMIDSLRGSSLLRGFRGSPPVDENFLGECVLRLDRLITDLPELEEFEVNPFLTGAEPDAFAALDIRARLRSGDQPASISPGSSKARP